MALRGLRFWAFVSILAGLSPALAMRVGVAPLRGDAKYPLVMNGIRQVLVSDLSRSGAFDVEEINLPESQLNASRLAETGSSINADVLLMGYFSEASPKFTVILRAYDPKSGYNIGAREVQGTYGEIKFLQDRLLTATLELLNTPIPPEKRTAMMESHTTKVGAVVALGEADVAFSENRYVDALEGLSKSTALDPQFGTPRSQIEQRGTGISQRITNSADLGRAYAYLGDGAKSIVEFDKALAADPNNPRVLVGKADVLAQMGKFDQAIALYQAATRVNPQNAFAALGLARVYERQGRSLEALAAYERARDLGATNPQVYEGLASLYAAKRQAKQAGEAYQTAGILAERQSNIFRAQQNYGKAYAITRSNGALEQQAAVFIASGELELAITTLTKALLAEPDKESILAKLGQAQYLNGEPFKAIKSFQRALNINPSNYEANLYLGLILMDDRDQRATAIKHLEEAARVRPNERETQFHLARVYLLSNRAAEAAAILERVAQANPRDPRTAKELADAYMLAEDFPRAEIAYTRAIELQPDYRQAHEGLVKAYVRMNKKAQALAEIEKVYMIDASNNAFVRGDVDFLASLTSPELLELVRSFPKTAMGDGREKPINQVSLLRLVERRQGVDLFKKFLQLYELRYDRIVTDLEIALFMRYRVIPFKRLRQFSSGTILRSEFKNDSYLRPAVMAERIDGLFGLDFIGTSTREEITEVTIDFSLFAVLGSQRSDLSDKSALPVLSYPQKEILRLNPTAPLSYAILAILAFLPIGYITIYRAHVKGRGNLRVVINYDPKLESFLTLKLSKGQEKERDPRLVIVKDKLKYQKRRYRELIRQKGAWVRNMVGRSTLFERVPARTFYCYLYGTIEDGTVTKRTVGNYYMFQKVTITKNATKEILFQLEKEEAFVTIFLRKGEEDVSGAQIFIDDKPEPLFSRGAAGTFAYLPKGRHVIRATYEGRTAEHSMEVHDLEDKIINLDLQTAEEAEQIALSERDLTDVAQDFQEQGRLDDAARLYDKAGDAAKAGEIRAEARLAEGDTEAAAKELVRNRDFIRAAEVYTQAGDRKKASYMYALDAYEKGEFSRAIQNLEGSENFELLAKIYDRMGEPKKAAAATARSYLSRGQKIEAAQAFIRAEEYADAADVYESLKDFSKAAILHAKVGNYSVAGELFAQAGDVKKSAMAFEKGGLFEQAISLYRDLGDTHKVVGLMVQDERYRDAAELYRQQGLIDEAIAMCQKVPPNHVDYTRTQIILAQMFGEKGLDDLGVKTFGDILATRPDLMDEESTYIYGSLLERQGQFAKALDVFEGLLKRDFQFRDVSIKVNELKTKASMARSVPQPSAASGVNETISGAAPLKDTRYDIIEELGRGAMGIVYKAKDKTLGRVVAFKTLPHTLKDDPAALESLMQEAQTAARLNHPNIVTVFDVGQEREHYFIAMEFVEGKTLQDVLKRIKKVPFDHFRHIARSLCDVVQYAHEQHVIHRDIKPSNILLTSNRIVKLMDFGLAKVLREISIDKTMLRGTPLYMSPEQILGKDIDHRTDLYSLGVLFYEMLAGRPPFFEGDIMYAHLHTPPPPLGDFTKDIPPQAIEAIMICLSKDKNARPADAAKLASVLGL